MPSVSAKQAKLMSAIAHGWDPPMKHAPTLAVAQDFHAADKKQGKFMHADGGKVGTLVNFAKAGVDALQRRIESAFDNPYTANPDQVREDIAKYWRTRPVDPTPVPRAPVAAGVSAAHLPHVADYSRAQRQAELDALAAKHEPERLGQFGDFLGGQIQQRMADNATKVAQLGHKYSPGDVVQGQQQPWRITGLTSTKYSPDDVGKGFVRSPDRAARPDLPAYHVESLNGDTQTTMAEWGIQHKFDGPRAIPDDDLQMAGGGKVGSLRRMMDYAESMFNTSYSTNSQKYLDLLKQHDWNPKVPPKDADMFSTLASEGGHHFAADNEDAVRELFAKYALTLGAPTTTYRGISNDLIKDPYTHYKPGSILKWDAPQSTSIERQVAQGFTTDQPDASLFRIQNPPGYQLLPNPMSGESELMLPSGDQGALSVLRRSMIEPMSGPDSSDELWSVLAQRKAGGGAVNSYAEGGTVDTPTNTDRFLGLIRHAADRASASVSDDPHHALARVAAGLASQVAGLGDSGHAQFGKTPGIVNETLSLPAGLTDMGIGAAQIGGALHDKLGSQPGVGGLTMQTMGHVRDALNNLQQKYGDLAPGWSRDAEAKTGQLHSAVHKAMGLGDPHGLVENLAEAGGTMLGQIPIGASKEGLTGIKALGKLVKSPIEWLGPTIRPSLANYAAGTAFGGLAGAAGGNDAQAAPSPYAADATSTPMKEQFQ